jgi:hypothetical protein
MGDVGFSVPGDAGGGGAVAGRGVDDEGKAAGVPAGKDERRRLQGRQLSMWILDNNRFGNQLRNWFLQLQSGMMTLRRDQINMRNEMKTEIAGVKQGMEQGFEIVNGNMKQYAMQASMAQRVRTIAGMEMLATAAAGGEELAMGSGWWCCCYWARTRNHESPDPNATAKESLRPLERVSKWGGWRKLARLFSATKGGSNTSMPG